MKKDWASLYSREFRRVRRVLIETNNPQTSLDRVDVDSMLFPMEDSRTKGHCLKHGIIPHAAELRQLFLFSLVFRASSK